jgi:hypothetical protein
MKRFGKYLIALLCMTIFHAYGFKKTGGDENIDVAKYKGQKIVIGNENTNGTIRDETIILKSGQVFSHRKGNAEYKFQKKLSNGDVHRIFGLIDRAAITSFNHPGDPSSFIEAYSRGKVTNYYIWGEAGTEVPGYILEDYTEILKIVR